MTTAATMGPLLVGETLATLRDDEVREWLLSADTHQVGPLLHAALSVQTGNPLLNSGLRDITRAEVTLDAVRQPECHRLCDAFAAGGVDVLIFKGTALAHSHYAASHLRPRDDTDLLVDPSARILAETLLIESGYTKAVQTEGALIAHQALFVKRDVHGVLHNIDLHWQISNRPYYAARFNCNELYSRSIPLVELGHTARAPCPVDAAAIACVHQSAHHLGAERLVWSYDIYLLLKAMSADELDEFFSLAERKSIVNDCAAAIRRAREHLQINVGGAKTTRWLSTQPTSVAQNAPRGWALWHEDLQALPTLSKRIAWLREQAFPPVSYMRARNPGATAFLLPWLYLRRGVLGLARLLRRRS